MDSQYTSAEALQVLMQQCSRQEKCTFDIVRLLNRWEVDISEHEAILAKLQTDGFLDDSRYAKAFVRDKFRFDRWGKIKIRYTLKMKGIPESIIRESFAEIDDAEYRDMVFHELEKKKKSLKGIPWEVTAKLFRYGSSRGYETDVMHDFLGGYGSGSMNK